MPSPSSAGRSEGRPAERLLRIGEVARATGLTIRTLRHYDDLGLLIPSGRSAGDYRLYDEADLRRLLAIQHLKALGLSLADVGAALDDPGFDARAALDAQIAEVEGRLAAERALLHRLQGLKDASAGGWAPVLDAIALTEALAHPEIGVRVRAALDAPADAPLAPLVDALASDPDSSVRETLTWAVARHGADAVEPLSRLLTHRTPGVRLQATHALSKLGERSAVPAIAPLLSDADPAVAAKAAFALGRLGGDEALAALAGALGASDPILADELADAVAGFGTAASGVLVEKLRSDDPRVRQQAADALALIADPATASALAEAVSDADPDVALAAVSALGELGPDAAPDAIAGATEAGDARVRALARRLQRR